MSAERCPICFGSGKHTLPPYLSCTALPIERTCHGCQGRGWVETTEPESAYPQVIHNSVSEVVE